MLKIALLTGTLIALAISAVAAPLASAKVNEFGWVVNGEELEKGSTREITVTDVTAFTLVGEVLGTKVEITSNKLKIAKGGDIVGGAPGTSTGTLIFENAKIVKPSECKIKGEKIETRPLRGETVASNTKEESKAEMLLAPASGTAVAEIEIEGCAVKGTVTLSGNVLAEFKPQQEETRGLKLGFEAPSKSYVNDSAKEPELTAEGLKLAGKAATLKGEAEMVLVSQDRMLPRSNGLQPLNASYTSSTKAGISLETTVTFENTNNWWSITIANEEPTIDGSTLWKLAAMQAANYCKERTTVSAGALCTVKVVFAPPVGTPVGNYNSVLHVRSNRRADVRLNGTVMP